MPNLTLKLEKTLASLLIVIFFLHSFLVFSTFLMVYTLPALATVAPLVHIIQHVISKTFTENWVNKKPFFVLILTTA